MENNLFSVDTYKHRRRILQKKIGSGQLLFLGNQESSKNFKDNWYPFRQDSTFLYYFGINQPNLIGLIDCDTGSATLFGDDVTTDDIVWTGPLPSLSELGKLVGINEVYPLSKLSSLISQQAKYLPPYRSQHTITLSTLLQKQVSEIREFEHLDFIQAVVSQRNIKSPEEVAELHRACSITSTMQLAVMQTARPGMKEYQIVAEAYKTALHANSQMSFLPILTKNGETLHNHYHGNTIGNGDMILFDGGTESLKHYAGDMTRTFPVGKSFTSKQKEIYDVVHSSFSAAVDMLKPEIKFIDVHLHAAEKLVEGLISIGLMKGDPKEAVAAGAHTLFFQCGLGHMIGLDVHDMENLGEQYVGYTSSIKQSQEFGLKSLRLGRALEEGFALTVEPGIYFIPTLIDQFKADRKFETFINYQKVETYRDFGGIRIENDYHITAEGASLLGEPLATSSSEIEVIRSSVLT